LHIDELIFEGTGLSQSDAAALAAALRQQLAALITAHGFDGPARSASGDLASRLAGSIHQQLCAPAAPNRTTADR
jgi:hypothetical protein